MFGFIKGLGVTLAQIPKKKVTLQYPEEKPQWPERFRGVHKYDPDTCIVCHQCARICPTSCISLSGHRNEDKKMRIDTYDIAFEICILCGLCVEVCPTESITMSDKFELAAYNRDELYKDMEWLHQNYLHYTKSEPAAETKPAESEAGKVGDQA